MLFLDKLKSKKQPRARQSENLWENPQVLEVNLIKDEMEASFNWSRNLPRLGLSLAIALLFVFEIYWGLVWWEGQENSRSEQIAADLNKVNQEIKLIKGSADEFMYFKDKMTNLPILLDDHVYWTNFFSWLESNTLNSVVYKGFSGDTGGSYILNADTKSFADVSYQVKTFLNNDKVISAKVDSVSGAQNRDKSGNLSIGGASFSVDLKVKPDIFKK